MGFWSWLLKRGSVFIVVLLCVSVYRRANYEITTRSMVEDNAIKEDWFPSQRLLDRLEHRRKQVHEVCHKYGLDTPDHPLNWREFLVNQKHHLVWCKVFKAASSTWLWNFNMLAGYSEEELLYSSEGLLGLSQAKYPRLSHNALVKALEDSPRPLVFMIARHPFVRLVSAYRDKVLKHVPFYQKLNARIVAAHPEMGPGKLSRILSILVGKPAEATFPQFVQYILDLHKFQQGMDEHWVPISSHCTPCRVNFTVIAKVETLEEDANYIIHTSGIKGHIRPKVINRAEDGSSHDLADQFLCQLTRKQVHGLSELYKYDLEMFEYKVNRYLECASHGEEK